MWTHHLSQLVEQPVAVHLAEQAVVLVAVQVARDVAVANDAPVLDTAIEPHVRQCELHVSVMP